MSISLYEEGEEEGVCVGDPIADCCAVVCTSNYTIMVIVNLSGCLSVGPSVYLYLSICQFIYISPSVSLFISLHLSVYLYLSICQFIYISPSVSLFISVNLSLVSLPK